jgi:DNA-binding beta-propeller fold protein YncE
MEVIDANGRSVARHDVSDWLIAYDPTERAFWLAGKQLTKLSTTGQVLTQCEKERIAPRSLEVDPKTGTVWMVNQMNPNVPFSNDELLGFDSHGKRVFQTSLEDRMPIQVVVDPLDGTVLVVCWRKAVLRFDSKGKRLAEHPILALSLAVEPSTGCLWVATDEAAVKLDRDGKEIARVPLVEPTPHACIVCY